MRKYGAMFPGTNSTPEELCSPAAFSVLSPPVILHAASPTGDVSMAPAIRLNLFYSSNSRVPASLNEIGGIPSWHPSILLYSIAYFSS